ncbi:EAL domain-containing protein [Azospirillum sp. RWY-5-1]|uniref:EAL domain-containing protein n=1 Tax=Azospirillum oleiclasticum TaxID=2735135 RepID=A0ABX2T5W0_9PROT|nr:EAL domain-containing protein [Azospirillum oleiclasticum]NYZ12549.1 EAL domain-containing protein [Azospirillum oleiclasticum]NYZ19709.1 EAL domain-containing protein [Azospirillum oleiclasticum]
MIHGNDKGRIDTLAGMLVLFVLGCIAFAFAMTLRASWRVDGIAAEESRTELRKALDDAHTTLGKRAIEYSVWNDAVDHLVLSFDADWATANVGPYAERLWRLDRSVAVDGADRLLYASADGALLATAGAAMEEVAALRPVFEAARGSAGTASGIVAIGQELYLFGASVLDREPGWTGPPLPAPLPVQVFLRSLRHELVRIGEDRNIARLHFDPAAGGPLASETPILHEPLTDISGRPVGSVAWVPERPGSLVIADAAPYGAAFSIALAALLLLFLRALLRLRRQDALHLSEARLVQAQRIARLAHAVHRSDGRLEASALLETMLGGPAGALTRLSDYLGHVPEDRRAELEEAYRAAWERRERFDLEYPLRCADNESLHVRELGEPVTDGSGRVQGIITVIQDITDRRRAEELIRYQARFDPLTNLPNRTMFFERLQQEIRRAQREGVRAALLFIDLDRFKWVNDTLGHGTGDLLLREAAARLQACVRETDTVARLGGDEFTVILSAIRSEAEVDRIVRRILATLEEPFQADGRTLHISASIGITFAPDQGTDPQVLLKNADVAMYQAKQRRAEHWIRYSRDMDADALERLTLEGDLRKALRSGAELELLMQPIVAMDSGRMTGAEALLRWHHPERGTLPPEEFVPMAETSGLIIPLGNWVLASAGRQLAEWRAQGLDDLRLAVNVSAVQIMHPEFERTVRGVIEANGVAPDRLVLELTESVMLDSSGHTLERMRSLHALGVRFALDDFGTGYASLNGLKQLPVSIVKIDRSFVHSMEENAADREVIGAVVRLAAALDIATVAEGVETPEQYSLIRATGCAFAQGFHIDPPMPAARFTRMAAGRDAPAAVVNG